MILLNIEIRRFALPVLFVPLSLLPWTGCQNGSSDSPDKPELQQVSAAQKSDRREWEEFFTQWLKGHNETNVVCDADGVGIEGNAMRLTASRYSSTKQQGGYLVEVEFRVRLPSGGEIVEYVAGMGTTEDQAVKDALANFTLTTFHVVYKSFMNSSDPHQTVETVPIGGSPRKLAMGDLYMRGDPDAPVDLNAMRPQIQDAISRLDLSDEPHWIKIVYGQDKGEPIMVSATLDNGEDEPLTSAIGAAQLAEVRQGLHREAVHRGELSRRIGQHVINKRSSCRVPLRSSSHGRYPRPRCMVGWPGSGGAMPQNPR